MSKYKKVYQDIKKKIEDQVWSTGQALPTENELMEIYSYSKDTIRKALSLLEMDGYIQKKTREIFNCNRTRVNEGTVSF